MFSFLCTGGQERLSGLPFFKKIGPHRTLFRLFSPFIVQKSIQFLQQVHVKNVQPV